MSAPPPPLHAVAIAADEPSGRWSAVVIDTDAGDVALFATEVSADELAERLTGHDPDSPGIQPQGIESWGFGVLPGRDHRGVVAHGLRAVDEAAAAALDLSIRRRDSGTT